jgi:hypothetical protein
MTSIFDGAETDHVHGEDKIRLHVDPITHEAHEQYQRLPLAKPRLSHGENISVCLLSAGLDLLRSRRASQARRSVP